MTALEHIRTAEQSAQASAMCYQEWGEETGSPQDKDLLEAAFWESSMAQAHAMISIAIQLQTIAERLARIA